MRTLIALTVFLTGCTDIVENFKEAPSQYYPTFTNEQLFTNKNLCKTTNWVTIKDERGRDIVQLECTMNSPYSGYEAAIDKLHNKQKKKVDDQINFAYESIKLFADAAEMYQNTTNIEGLKKLVTPTSHRFYAHTCVNDIEKMSYSVKNGELIADDVISETTSLCAVELYEVAIDYEIKIANNQLVLEKTNNVKQELYNEVPVDAYLVMEWVVTENVPAEIVGASMFEVLGNGQRIESTIHLDRVLAQAVHTTMNPYDLTRYLSTTSKSPLLNKLDQKLFNAIKG